MSFHASSTVASPAYLDSSNLGSIASPHPELFAFTSYQHQIQNQNQQLHGNFPINAHAQSSSTAHQQGSMNSSNLNMTSPGADFADLLAEFTLPANALSPADANAMLGNSPGVPPSYVDHYEALIEANPSRGGGGGGHQLQQSRQHHREPSAQELVLQHIGFSLAPSTSTPSAHPSSPNLSHSGGDAMSNSATDAANAPSQITNVIATMDPAARSQLLNALLALKQQHQQTNPTSTANSPTAASSAAAAGVAASPRHQSPSRMGSSHPSAHENPSSSQRSRSSAPSYTNSPLMTAHNGPSRSTSSSAQASPMAYYGTGVESNVSTPHAYHSHHCSGSASTSTGNSAAMVSNPSNNYLHQIATSLPPSNMPSPLASPYTSMQQQSSQQMFDASAMQQHHQHVSAQLQAHNASLAAANQSSQQQQIQNAFGMPGYEMEQNALSRNNAPTSKVQAAIDMLTRVGGNGGVSGGSINGDMNPRGGSSTTGGSYATHPEGDDWAGSNDFMFSPLMSPAMTPQSVFTTASSLPPSGSFPPKNALVSPAEFFSPLGSPAIMPQQFNDDPAAAAIWQAQQLQHRASLQGLVDQTRALGFDTSNLAAIQAAYSPYVGATMPSNATSATGSPANAGPTTASPRLDSNDAGSSTAAGAGRRGAGSRKARPSPLLKPTPDGQLVRRGTGKKATASAAGDRRSASIGNGARSATTSPFLGPSATGRITAPTGNGGRGAAGGAVTGSQRSSPSDDATTNAISADTPSPVDLSSSRAVAETLAGACPAFAMNGSQLMGPPPLPSSAASSRRSSIVPNATPVQQQDATMATADWLHQAATPATFMNLPNNIAGVSSLSHASIASTSGETQQPQDSNALLTPPDQGAGSLTNAARDSTSPSTNSTGSSGSGPATSSSSKGKSTKSALASARKIAARPIKASRIAPAPLKPKTTLTPSPTEGSKVKEGEKEKEKEKDKPMEKRKYKGKEKEKEPGAVKMSEMDNDTDAGHTSTAMKDDALGDLHASTSVPGVGGELRRTSHKAAEQKRRDSLKQCFELLRRILPPIAMNATPDEEKRPGEGNVGGQRSGSVDPENPNRGVSKVALLRRSNEYVGMLHDRIDRRDGAIDALRRRVAELRERLGEEVEEADNYIDGFELDALDKDEKKAGNVFFYENLDDDDEEEEEELRPKGKSSAAPKRTGSLLRRKSNAAAQVDEISCAGKDAKDQAVEAGRRSTRNSLGASEHESMKMDVEAEAEV